MLSSHFTPTQNIVPPLTQRFSSSMAHENNRIFWSSFKCLNIKNNSCAYNSYNYQSSIKSIKIRVLQLSYALPHAQVKLYGSNYHMPLTIKPCHLTSIYVPSHVKCNMKRSNQHLYKSHTIHFDIKTLISQCVCKSKQRRKWVKRSEAPKKDTLYYSTNITYFDNVRYEPWKIA